MESYAKYADVERVNTCLLIDEPAQVLAGRTMGELGLSLAAFFTLAYFYSPFAGLLAAILTGVVLPMYRMRYVRGFLTHLAWSFGLWFPGTALFTLRLGTVVLGP